MVEKGGREVVEKGGREMLESAADSSAPHTCGDTRVGAENNSPLESDGHDGRLRAHTQANPVRQVLDSQRAVTAHAGSAHPQVNSLLKKVHRSIHAAAVCDGTAIRCTVAVVGRLHDPRRVKELTVRERHLARLRRSGRLLRPWAGGKETPDGGLS